VFGIVRVLLGVLEHLESPVTFLSLTELTSVNIDIGSVEENVRDLVSKDDPEISRQDPSTFDLVLSVLFDIGEGSFGDLLRVELLVMDIKIGVGTLGLDVAVEGVGSLFGFSGGFRGSLAISAYDSVVGNGGGMVKGIGGSLSRPEQRTHEEVVPLEGVVLPDDLAVDVR